jgi:hypothetical protein
MSRQLLELELILRQMVQEHRRMIQLVDAQQLAMKKIDLKAMDDATNAQEACRLRIVTLENKRRNCVLQIARASRMLGEPKIQELAKLDKNIGPALLKLRDDLRQAMDDLSRRTHVAGRLAGAVLGHLNTVVRLIAGAVEQAGLYTKQGVPKVSARIGVIEAVG